MITLAISIYFAGYAMLGGSLFLGVLLLIIPSFRRKRPETEKEKETRLRKKKKK